MLYRNVGLLFAILLVSGCATKSHFVYDHPQKNLDHVITQMEAEVSPVQDMREGKKEIDKIYSGNPLKDIQAIVIEELASSGLFRSVEASSEGQKRGDATILVETSLKRMNWVVPEYNAILGKMFAASFLTGGIGGVVYGSTETEVNGEVGLDLRLVEAKSGKILFEKEYDGRCKKQMVKMQCDTPKTKATMVGESLKNIMVEVKGDLRQVLNAPDTIGLSLR